MPYQTNIQEQYEELGRFVEAFEYMANEVRECNIALLSREGKSRYLIEIAFHHYALSAKPLYDIFRAIVGEIVQPPMVANTDIGLRQPISEPPPSPFKPAERDAIAAVMKRISAEYLNLVETRNEMLHGTWHIGYLDGNPEAKEFHIAKYDTTKSGLSPVTGLPKTALELRILASRCSDVRSWIGWVLDCLLGKSPVLERFTHENGEWFLVLGGNKTTLPQKWPQPSP